MNLLNQVKAKLSKIKWIIQGKTSYDYWNHRYSKGGNSGDGSYNALAQFKAEVISDILAKNNIQSAIEFGCGDGNQLTMINYPNYIGFDISNNAIERCKNRFSNDSSKKFYLTHDYSNQTADLAMSLDVIYHLVEDSTFNSYMLRLFSASNKYILIYSSNFTCENKKHPIPIIERPHEKHRIFTQWIEIHQPDWILAKK